MNRTALLLGCSAAAFLATSPGYCQQGNRNQKTIVIGALRGENHGHVVIVRPGSDRVWDGNTLGGFKDLKNGQTVSNRSVLDRMYWFVKAEYPADLAEITRPTRPPQGANASDHKAYQEKLDGFHRKMQDFLSSTAPNQRQRYVDAYVEKGAPITHSWPVADRQRIQYYQVPTSEDVRDVLRSYQPPAATTVEAQNLRCNDLVRKAAPQLTNFVHETLGSNQPVHANNIAAALEARSRRAGPSGNSDTVSRVDAGATTCPRCNGSGYVGWSDIDRLGMRNYWIPGPCRMCGGSGKVTQQRLREKDVRSTTP